MRSRPLIALVTVFCFAAFVPVATADFQTTYPDSLGTLAGQVDFLDMGESTVTDSVALFGAPTRAGNSLYFSPTAFASMALEGSADTTTGVLTLRIRADEGMHLGKVGVAEVGNYMLFGSGTCATSASIAGTLTVTNVAGQALAVVPPSPFTLPGDSAGSWQASAEIDLSIYNLTEVDVVFENILMASSESGTTSFIQKLAIEGMSLSIEQLPVTIPEPMTFALFGTVALGAFVYRRLS